MLLTVQASVLGLAFSEVACCNAEKGVIDPLSPPLYILALDTRHQICSALDAVIYRP
jgi:hypothetical protein